MAADQIKYRIYPWGDTHTGKEWYGIQAKRPGDARWLHAYRTNAPLVFPTRDEAREEIKRLKETTDGR